MKKSYGKNNKKNIKKIVKNQKGVGKKSLEIPSKKYMKVNEVKSILIPHAGKDYAGDARKNAFIEALKGRPVKSIIYLAALHNSSNVPNNLYIFNGDSRKQNDFPDNVWNEHSFRWVYNELKENFKLASITVVIVPLTFDLNKAFYEVEKLVSNSIKRCLVIGTTDLLHYGKNYQMTDLEYPQQLSKIRREEKFINAIVQSNTQKVIELYNKDNNLACGPIPIILLSLFSEKNKWFGKVVDYYDSHGVMRKNSIDKYSIDTNDVESFVSYVSIVYHEKKEDDFPSNINIKLSLGNVKSVISFKSISDIFSNHKVNKINLKNLVLPIWSQIRNHKGGIFVGTSVKNNINCSYGRFQSKNPCDVADELTNSCYGRYQDNSKNTAQMLIDASADCPRDARERWKIPISFLGQKLSEVLKVLDNLKYKVEFLEENTLKSPWKEISANEFAFGTKNTKPFTSDNPFGIYLTFKTSTNQYLSATYVPNVWKESLPNSSAAEVLDELSQKAGGIKERGAWRNDSTSTVKLYRSYKYEWSSEKEPKYFLSL